MKKRLFGLVLTLVMIASIFVGMIVTANAATGEPTHTNHDGWQAISQVGDRGTTLTEGKYYLSENITAGSSIEIGENQVVTLCLNGKALTFSTTNSTIRLAAGSTLNICDCQAGTVTTYGNINENGVWVKADVSGNADLSGGVITRSVDRSISPLISSVADNTTLNMYSGNLAGNRRSGDNSYAHHKDSAGISLQTSSSSINLYGGTLTGLVAPKGASAIYTEGSLNLAGAVIEKNQADKSSTIVWLQSSGTAASMTGGAIRNNIAYQSGAIFMYSGNETFTMSGGEISGNQAQHGGVQVDSGTFKMTGGEIKNNVATGDGGGIFAGGGGDGIAEISGGKIYGNTAANNGGGVCVGQNGGAGTGSTPLEGILKVSGGQIYGNTAEKHGSGVYVAAISTNTLELSGDAYIYENFKSDGVTASNVTLYGDASIRTSHQKITVGTFTSNAKVGVGFENVKGYRTFTKEATTDVTSVFVSDNSDLILSMGSDGQAILGYEIRLELTVTNGTFHWEKDENRTELTVTPTLYNAKGEKQNASFTYAWRKSAQEDLSGDTYVSDGGAAKLRVLATGEYYYFCNVSVAGEMAPPVRSEATYVVLNPYTFVTITGHPQSIELYPNELAADHKLTVTATVDHSDSNLIYQWYMTLPGGTKTEIPGATSAEYIIPKDLPVGKTTFSCVVDAEGASYTRSTSATVTVKEPEITITPKYGSDQISITMLDEYTLEVAATCVGYDGPLQYQWYTCRYNDGTSRTIITGATSASYTFKPDSSGYKYLICEVTAGGTTKFSSVAKLYVQSVNVYINTDIPNYASYSVALGGTRTLTIAASGPQGMEVGYQWYSCTDRSKSNATPVEGATGASFNVPTDTKGTCYYFCRAYLVGHDTIYKESRVAQINVYVAYNLTTADPVGDDGWATVAGGKYSVNPTCAAGGYCSINVAPDDGYTVDTVTVYKTGDPGVIVYSGPYTSFDMPEYDVTVKVTFKVPTPIEKVDLQIDWSRVPGIAVGDDLLAIDYEFSDSYLPAVFVDGEGVCNGSVYYTYLAIKVTNANAQRIADATGYDAEELLYRDGYGTWLPVYSLGYCADEFILDANDELAIMVYIYAYDGYFPSDDDGMYTGAVTCNNESVAFNVAYYDELISFIEAGKVSEITAEQTNAGTADRYNVYFYDNYGYTNGGSYGVMPGIVKEGETVTIRITPNAGYEIDTVSWFSFIMPSDLDDEGEEINIVTAVDGVYSFTMPAIDVIVTVTFKEAPVEHEHSYTYTSNNNGTHNGACTCGEDAIVNQTCTYVGGQCEKCGHPEPVAPPVHTHSYTYTSNNNGTHNGACTCGEDAIVNQTCTYVGGQCEKCGHPEPVAPPVHTHSYTYTSNNNGTHNGACTCGEDAIVNQTCTYVGGKCEKCGHPEPVAPPVHAHFYTYTSNNNGTHNGACDCGEASIVNLPCTYVAGQCYKCGYVEPVTPPAHEHSYTYTSNNNGTHNGNCECGEDAITNEACAYGDDEVCDLCGYDSHEHKYTYTNNNNGTHNGACECGEDAITNEACAYGNDEVCDKCGYDSHEHEYTYTNNNNGTHNGSCECGEDAITNEACTYADSKCDKCGYVEPVAPPTVNVPVSNNENKVDVEAEISGNDAAINPLDEEQIDKLVGSENASGDVVIDLSKLDESIDTAGIPKSTLEAIVNAAEDAGNKTEHLVIKLSTAELKLDDTAMRAIVDQSNGDVIKFNFDDVGLDRLNATQKDAVKDMDVRKGYEAYITVNDQRIGDFKGGEVEIIVPYAVPEGEDVASFSVWYVDDDGTLEKQQSTYDGKEKCFIVTHFSDYVIVYSAEDAPQTAGGSMWIIWIILIILICVITYFIYKKRKSRKNQA